YPTPQPGTVPLMLYFSKARLDNFTSATPAGAADARKAGYDTIRVEGYVYPNDTQNVSRPADTVPLLLYSNWPGENVVALPGGLGDNPAGYNFVRVEGYVFRPDAAQRCQLPALRPLDLFWSDGRSDNFTTGTVAGENAAWAGSYQLIRTEGHIWTTPAPGSMP